MERDFSCSHSLFPPQFYSIQSAQVTIDKRKRKKKRKKGKIKANNNSLVHPFPFLLPWLLCPLLLSLALSGLELNSKGTPLPPKRYCYNSFLFFIYFKFSLPYT
jgi:hypothetical protein